MRPETVQTKVEELKAALKDAGLWLDEEPSWVREYEAETEKPDMDFFEWLQFVYLPNRLMNGRRSLAPDNYITMQAKRFAAKEKINEKLIRLLIELDAI